MTPDRDRPPDDEELVLRHQADPEGPAGRAAAEELLGRYRARAYLWCHRLLRDHERALDVAQEALLDAWRGLARFERRSRFSSWLFTIVRNRCHTALRPRRLLWDEEVDPDEQPDPAGDAEAAWLARESGEALEKLLMDTLDPPEQDAIWLRCVERLPLPEITRRLDLRTASGARGLLQTARRKLRAALQRQSAGEAEAGAPTAPPAPSARRKQERRR